MPISPFRRSLRAPLAGCLLHVVGVAAAAAPSVTVETTAEESVGRLVSIDPEGGVVLQDDSYERVPAEAVLAVRFNPARRQQDAQATAGEVGLSRGSRFEYAAFDFTQVGLRFTLRGGVRVQVPIPALSAWRLSATPSNDDLTTANQSDVLTVKRRDGESTSVEGAVLAVTEAGVRFALNADSGSEPVEAPWSRVVGLRFYRDEASVREAPAVVVTLADGGRFVADRAEYVSGELHWRGDETSGSAPAEAIASIDLSAGRVLPVAALELTASEWTPYFGKPSAGAVGFAFDRALGGAELSLRFPDRWAPAAWPAVSVERKFARGVALRSQGELRFALPPDALRLRGWIGIDPATARAGSAEVAVRAGNEILWSGAIDGSVRPIALNAPLGGAASITLRVDYGDNLDAGDNVHFADLRVIR